MSGLQTRSEKDSLGRSPGAVSSSVPAPAASAGAVTCPSGSQQPERETQPRCKQQEPRINQHRLGVTRLRGALQISPGADLQQWPQAEEGHLEQTRVDGDLQPSSACSSGHGLSLSGSSSKSAPSSNAPPVYRAAPTGEAAASVSCDLLAASPACDIPAVRWDREGMGEFGGGETRELNCC